MAKLQVCFEMKHEGNKRTNGNIVFQMDIKQKRLHELVQRKIARQFNCPISFITITNILIQ
ncbi:hypothetical protein ACFFJY_15340 [Fictibacillus aquaticus]|uniref:Uncharacterized protein n=1 Tax=Fictibacillus aquaticus TaxID=2021314 RepID=A0A235FF13_9BACL|nr:hypothetical protein [Fictibacillus aquaticus]OYD59583.1 hypothetical protein CGZ90_06755 [Fictibacillus aquaticus]